MASWHDSNPVTASERIRGARDMQDGYDAGYAKRLLDPTRGRKFSAGYALGCEHRLADDGRADLRWPSDYAPKEAVAMQGP